jgi:hypothetical protein
VVRRAPAVPVAEEAPARPLSYGGRLVRSALVGALLALALRLLVAAPADVYALVLARVLGSGAAANTGRPPAGSLDAWRQGPVVPEGADRAAVIDPDFLRQFIFATWWVGGVVGVALVARYRGRVADYACGAVAGAAAGAAAAATAGCLLAVFDAPPRAVVGGLAAALGSSATSVSPWLATPLWLLLTAAWWAVLGGGLGLALGAFGARGGRALAAVAAPLSRACRACGLGGAAAFFALR